MLRKVSYVHVYTSAIINIPANNHWKLEMRLATYYNRSLSGVTKVSLYRSSYTKKLLNRYENTTSRDCRWTVYVLIVIVTPLSPTLINMLSKH